MNKSETEDVFLFICIIGYPSNSYLNSGYGATMGSSRYGRYGSGYPSYGSGYGGFGGFSGGQG